MFHFSKAYCGFSIMFVVHDHLDLFSPSAFVYDSFFSYILYRYLQTHLQLQMEHLFSRFLVESTNLTDLISDFPKWWWREAGYFLLTIRYCSICISLYLFCLCFVLFLDFSLLLIFVSLFFFLVSLFPSFLSLPCSTSTSFERFLISFFWLFLACFWFHLCGRASWLVLVIVASRWLRNSSFL